MAEALSKTNNSLKHCTYDSVRAGFVTNKYVPLIIIITGEGLKMLHAHS